MNKSQRKKDIQVKASQALGKDVPFSSMSESDLRLEIALASQSSIRFNVLANVGTTLASEIRLNLNDAFVITHIGLRVAKVAAASPTANQVVNKKMYCNPNPFVFDGAAGDVNIAAIYNSSFSFEVNKVKYIPNLSTHNFLRYGDMQEGSATGINATPTTVRQANDSLPNGLFGYWECDEMIITGTQDIVPLISLPAGFSSSFTETNEVNYAILLLKGYLLQNMGTFSA
jgi:hypothetical protein